MRSHHYLVWMVVLGVVVLLNLPLPASLRVKSESRDGFAPFQNGLSLAVQRGREWLAWVAEMKSREAERNRLRDQVAVLRDRILALEDAKRENEQLRRQMGFGQRSARRLIPCRAVFRGDTTGWWQTIRLNRGAADGIRPEMPVITADGLIGKTREVSDRACEVLLLTDPNCRVSCRLSRTGTFGILRGGGVALSGRPQIEMLCSVRPARLDYLPREEEVRRGDEVVTSGLGGVFPDGLPVGCVVRGRIDPSGLYQRADIALAADISALDHVFVVVGNHGAAAERKGE